MMQGLYKEVLSQRDRMESEVTTPMYDLLSYLHLHTQPIYHDRHPQDPQKAGR